MRPLLLAALLLPATATARPVVTAGVDDWNFPSGLRVMLLEDHRFPVSRMVLTLDAGAADAPADDKELAHLVEHLAFRRVHEGDVTLAQQLGGLGCTWNGHTTADFTSFETACPSDTASQQLQVLAGLLADPVAGVTERDLAAEARIATQEARLRADGLAMPLARAVRQTLYDPTHPYHLPGGAEEALAGATLADARAFTEAHYLPANAVLVVSGDVEPGDLADLLLEHLPPSWIHPELTAESVKEFPAGVLSFLGHDDAARWYADPTRADRPVGFVAPEYPAPNRYPPPAPPADRTAVVEVPTDDPGLAVAWTLPGADKTTYWSLDWLELFAEAELEAALAKSKDARAGGCRSDPAREASTLICWAFHDPDANVDKLTEAMTSMFDGRWNLPREERIRATFEGFDSNWNELLERDAGGLTTAWQVADHVLLTDHPLYWKDKFEWDVAIEMASYKRRTKEWMGPERAAVLTLSPRRATTRADEDEALATTRAAAAADLGRTPEGLLSALGDREVVTLDNGLRVVHVPVDGYRVAHVAIAIDRPDDVPPAWARVVEDRAATKDGSGPHRITDGTTLWWWTVRSSDADRLGEFLPHVRDAVWARPRGGAMGDLEAALVTDWRNPSYWWEQLVWQRLTGSDGMLGASPADLAAVAGTDDDDAAAWLRRWWSPSRTTLYVVGDYEREDIDEAIDDSFGRWKASDGPARSEVPTPTTWSPEPLVALATLDEGANTGGIAWTCPLDLGGAEAPKAWATRAVTATLAQDVLWEALRHQSGEAYTVSAWSWSRWGGGLLSAEAQVARGRGGQALRDLQAALATLAAQPPGAEAVRAAAARVADRVDVATDSTSDTVDRLVWAEEHLGVDGLDGAPAALAGVTPADVQRALSGCADHGIVLVVDEPAALDGVAGTLGWDTTPFDWEASHLERVGAQLPKRLDAERRLLE